MSYSSVATRGRITIPAGIRNGLGLKANDRAMFTRLADGTVVMKAKTRSSVDLKGMLNRPESLPKVAMQIGEVNTPSPGLACG